MGCKLKTAITIFVIISVSLGIIYMKSNSNFNSSSSSISSSNTQPSSIPAAEVPVTNDSKESVANYLNQMRVKKILPENDPEKQVNSELKPKDVENIIDQNITPTTIKSKEPEVLTDTMPKDTSNLNQDQDPSNLKNNNQSNSTFNLDVNLPISPIIIEPEPENKKVEPITTYKPVSAINTLSEPNQEVIPDKKTVVSSGKQDTISTNELIPPWIQT